MSGWRLKCLNVTCFVSFVLCYALIYYFMFFTFSLLLCFLVFLNIFCFLFCVLYVLCIVLCIVSHHVYCLFVYNFTENCHQVPFQLQLINIT